MQEGSPSRRIVIIGAGPHGREVLDILHSRRAGGDDVEALGFLDESPLLRNQTVDGIPVLGDLGWFETADTNAIEVICAIGTPHAAREVVTRLESLDLRYWTAVSPSAVLSPRSSIGRGVMIFPNAVVNPGANVGAYSTLNIAATVSHDATIGAFCSIGPGAHIAGNAFLGEGCFVGMGANLIQRVSVGAWSVVGAGAVVLSDVPDDVTVAGVPARIVKESASRAPITPPE